MRHLTAELLIAERARVLTRDEPYRGVQALWHADLHTACPGWAPRADHHIIVVDGVQLLTGTGQLPALYTEEPDETGLAEELRAAADRAHTNPQASIFPAWVLEEAATAAERWQA